MRRFFHLDLHIAENDRPWRDLIDLCDEAEELADQHDREAENLAMLIDRIDYTLNSEYYDRITDPDDPKLKAERNRREALGIKPPPQPLIPPVALRPDSYHRARLAVYEALVDQYRVPDDTGQLTVEQYMQLRGISYESAPTTQ